MVKIEFSCTCQTAESSHRKLYACTKHKRKKTLTRLWIIWNAMHTKCQCESASNTVMLNWECERVSEKESRKPCVKLNMNDIKRANRDNETVKERKKKTLSLAMITCQKRWEENCVMNTVECVQCLECQKMMGLKSKECKNNLRLCDANSRWRDKWSKRVFMCVFVCVWEWMSGGENEIEIKMNMKNDHINTETNITVHRTSNTNVYNQMMMSVKNGSHTRFNFILKSLFICNAYFFLIDLFYFHFQVFAFFFSVFCHLLDKSVYFKTVNQTVCVQYSSNDKNISSFRWVFCFLMPACQSKGLRIKCFEFVIWLSSKNTEGKKNSRRDCKRIYGHWYTTHLFIT